VSDGLAREEALQEDLNLERRETSRLRARAQEERAVNSALRGDNEALLAEAERLQGGMEAVQAELTHVQTTLRIMRATVPETEDPGDCDDDKSSESGDDKPSGGAASVVSSPLEDFEADRSSENKGEGIVAGDGDRETPGACHNADSSRTFPSVDGVGTHPNAFDLDQ